MKQEFIETQILRDIYHNPAISQRELAKKNGISLGKTNYLLKSLLTKGLIKIENFKRADNKKRYLYIITPHGLIEKTRLTVSFLKRKMDEYERLKQEIEELKQEVTIP